MFTNDVYDGEEPQVWQLVLQLVYDEPLVWQQAYDGPLV